MSDRAKILVVEDRASLRRLLTRALGEQGYRVADAADLATARRLVDEDPPDLVLTDLRLPDGDGVELLRHVRRRHPRLPVVVMTAYGSVGEAVEAMKLGAADFLEKPMELETLLERVALWTRQEAEGEPALTIDGVGPLIGGHPRFRAALRMIRQAAAGEATVLLLGESGTGKELFARALHQLSARASGPFVAINCAAVPATLLESELFGHERGAFTGADRRQIGRFEQAAGGTLLLDEVGELPAEVQAKILRVLEEKTFERIGGRDTLRADVRLVAATNRDLAAMVEQGEFRADLYYRLEVFPVTLPPLRDRRADLPALAAHLIGRAAERNGREAPELSAEALETLIDREWPGNVRQLSNVLERATILCDGERILPEHLIGLDPAPAAGGRSRADREESEEARVRRALLAHDGDKERAAADLGMSYRSLQRRVKRFDLESVGRYRD